MLQKVGHNIINDHNTMPSPYDPSDHNTTPQLYDHPETTHQGVIIHPCLNNHAGGIEDSFC